MLAQVPDQHPPLIGTGQTRRDEERIDNRHVVIDGSPSFLHRVGSQPVLLGELAIRDVQERSFQQ